MALDRENTFREAERHLRQGKLPQALALCRRLAEEAPRDLLMLNRVGDLLARAGRTSEAVGYYDRIAEQFLLAGFLPRAIAILKKVLKLDPSRTDVLARLGELYVKQQLLGEGRTHLLHAADRFVKARQYSSARGVYEKLVAADPGDPVHRVRLAEARAAEGTPSQAGEDLLVAAAALEGEGRHSEAETTYRRATELLTDRAEPSLRLARFFAAQGRAEEALGLLEDLFRRWPEDGAVAAELLLRYESAGHEGAAERLLADPRASGIGEEDFESWVNARLARDPDGRPLEALEPVLRSWLEDGRTPRAIALLERLSRVDPEGWRPALERLHAIQRDQGDRDAVARVVERLVRACQAAGREADGQRWAEELRRVAPKATPVEPAAAGAEGAPRAALPGEALAPAVPVRREDEEDLAGHLTEAEVFEKYGLIQEAIRQLRQAAQRFPGHVGAQERLVELFRAQHDRAGLAATLVDLAVARRAAGDEKGAREAAIEAERLGALAPEKLDLLRTLSLLEAPQAKPAKPVRKAARKPPAIPTPRAPKASPVPPPAPTAQAESPVAAHGGEELEIVFGEAPAAPAKSEAPREGPARARGPRVPEPDVLEEVAFYVEQGMMADAIHKVEALRTLGYGGAPLDDLEARARRVDLEAAAEPVARAPARTDRLDDDDLESLAHLLEAELDGLSDEPAVSSEIKEQSVDEVLATFKQHVEREVGADDYRTHYDLGIAYKEMGLMEDAMEAFRKASETPSFRRQACTLLASCQREQGDLEEAARWYREALEAPSGPDDVVESLQYDLAEVLLAAGDAQSALDLFLVVLEADPGYREVRTRVSELRARLAT